MDKAEALAFFATGMKAIKDTFSALKTAKELLPDNRNKVEISKTIDEAEHNFKIAEAQIAQGLGYEICQCKFPPVIMTNVENIGDTKIFKCPECGKKFPELDNMLFAKAYTT